MEKNFNESIANNGAKSLFSDNLSVKDQINLFLSREPKTQVALKDLNSITKEKLAALENAQRKWVQEIRNWTTTDEIQKAQLEWIKRFSSFPSFNTVNSPEKKKDAPWTLPFSPPRSSYETSSRRGYCVYEPSARHYITARKLTKNINENGSEVKVTQLVEPARDKNITTEKAVLSTSFSPFSETKLNKVDKSERKRFITVRKKLHCLKKLEEDEAAKERLNMESAPKSKSGNTPERSEEERRAARKYIQRKRVERDRQLREQKEQEERAEQERKARMERLKETQHRILANSAKKQPKQQQKNKEDWVGLINQRQEEDKPVSKEMAEPPEYTGAHITGAIPFLSPRGKQNSSEKGSKTTEGTSVIAETEWIQDENVPPPEEEFMGNMTLHSKPVVGEHLLSSLSPFAKTKSDSPSDMRQSSKSSTSTRLKDLFLQKPVTLTLESVTLHSKSSSETLPQSSLESLCKEKNQEIIAAQSPSNSSDVHGDFSDPVKLSNGPVKDNDLLKTISFSTELKHKDQTADDEKPSRVSDDNFFLFTSSGNLSSSNSLYNVLTAVSNKRSALKELEHVSVKKQPKLFSCFENTCHHLISKNRFYDDPINSERKEVHEKGVQCLAENYSEVGESTSDQLCSSNSSSEAKLIQSERLRKPNLILLPGRLSDPCVYSATKHSTPNVPIDTTVPNNLSIDPLNLSTNLSLAPKQVLNDVFNISSPKPMLKVSEGISNFESSSFRGLNERNEESLTSDEAIGSLEITIDNKNGQIVNQDYSINATNSCTARALQISSAIINKLRYEEGQGEPKRDTIRDFSMTTSCDTTLTKSMNSTVPLDLQRDDISFTNFAKFSLNMFIDLLREESLRSREQESHFKMRENSIIDKTKAEIAYLELEKKKLKVLGNEDGVRNVRKKIRGLIMKLQQNLEDFQFMKKMEKAAYRGRRKLLLEKIDIMKDQLRKQMESEWKGKEESSMDTSYSPLDSNKEQKKDYSASSFENPSQGRKVSVPAILDKSKREDKDCQKCELAWKEKLEEGERRIQELEALIKVSPLSGDKDVRGQKMVERGTSPLRLSSDDDKKKGDYSYSDTFDQLSTSSQHDKLEHKDARKMIALKIPLSPRITLKRRYSSGSDESLLLSQTETQSDASDMETRVMALQQQLKQRKTELESLHREYKKSQRERLIAKEQSLLSQIQAYDMYIEQVRKELEKERDGSEVKIVKPVIKHPKLSCERRKSDTWLLQDRRCIKNNTTITADNTNVASQLTKHKKVNICKTLKDDEFFDNQALEKLILKTDFPAEVSDNDRPEFENQFISPVVSIGQKVDNCGQLLLEPKESDDIKADEMLPASGLPLEVHDISLIHMNNYRSVSGEETGLSSLKEESDQNEDNYLKNRKIDFYEKSSEIPPSSVETDSTDTVTSTSKSEKCSLSAKSLVSEQDLCFNEQNESSSVGLVCEKVNKNCVKVKLNAISSDLNEVEKDIRHSVTESKLSLRIKTCENSSMIEKETKVDEPSNKQEPEEEIISPSLCSESYEDTGFIKSITDSRRSNEGNNSKIKSDETYTVTDIVENMSNSDIKGITRKISSITSKIDVKESESSNIEDSVIEISELLYEGPETIFKGSNDEMTISSKEKEDNLNKEILKQISANKVIDASCSCASNESNRVHEESHNSFVGKSTYEDELMEPIARYPCKKESIIEEVISSIDSEELTSGASLPLPIFDHKVSEVSDREITATEIVSKDIIGAQHIIEADVESVISQVSSYGMEPSNLDKKLDTANSLSEEINTDFSHTDTSEEEQIRSEVEVSMKEQLTGFLPSNSSADNKSSIVEESFSEEIEEALDRSITQNLEDDSISEEQQEDSLDEDVKSKLLEIDDDEYASSNSFIDDGDIYNLLKNDGTEKSVAAPLIDALQREGDTAVDQLWRGIADKAVDDATNLVISTFLNIAHKDTRIPSTVNDQSYNNLVGDSDDDEWDGEKLQRQQAEAEVLRLQQLRIDKEIEELEEEEARRCYYIRSIPDKPPPPYTPRRSSLVTSVVEAASEIWDGKTETPPTFMTGCHLREFLWDLAAELVMRVRPATPPPQPVWIHTRRLRLKQHIRTKEQLLERVEKEAKIYLGVIDRECRENLIIRWSRKRRDHVDEILVKESQEEEWEWTDYSEEENIIKNRIADAVIQESLTTATAAIAQAFVKKFHG